MEAICDLYSIRFIAYSQPMLENKSYCIDSTLERIIDILLLEI